MKTKTAFLCILLLVAAKAVCALPLPPIPDPFVSPFMGESEFTRSTTSEVVYFDWIVSASDLAPSGVTFVFSKGDKSAYDLSTYFYYGKIENAAQTNIGKFSLNIPPGTCNTAGYILNVDLDNPATFNHNISGEHDDSSYNGPVNPSSATFDDTGMVPNASWDFDPELLFENPGTGQQAEFSSVMFISCCTPPEYGFASILDGSPAFDGELPVPTVIPEPISCRLLLSGIIALFLKKK